jgi:hypothetical protein
VTFRAAVGMKEGTKRWQVRYAMPARFPNITKKTLWCAVAHVDLAIATTTCATKRTESGHRVACRRREDPTVRCSILYKPLNTTAFLANEPNNGGVAEFSLLAAVPTRTGKKLWL